MLTYINWSTLSMKFVNKLTITSSRYTSSENAELAASWLIAAYRIITSNNRLDSIRSSKLPIEKRSLDKAGLWNSSIIHIADNTQTSQATVILSSYFLSLFIDDSSILRKTSIRLRILLRNRILDISNFLIWMVWLT